MKYVKATTGVEPTQDEIAEMLKSYFILNEVGNQIKYHLKKKGADDESEANAHTIKSPIWKLNLLAGPGKNILARAGLFQNSILDAIQTINDFMINAIGAEPSTDILSKSLQSSFILSEIKNQIDWQRKNPKKSENAKNQ